MKKRLEVIQKIANRIDMLEEMGRSVNCVIMSDELGEDFKRDAEFVADEKHLHESISQIGKFMGKYAVYVDAHNKDYSSVQIGGKIPSDIPPGVFYMPIKTIETK